MITRGQTIKLGIFLFGCAVIALGLFVFFVRERLFESTATYYVRVPGSVNGLAQGAPLAIQGVRVLGQELRQRPSRLLISEALPERELP